MTTFAVVCADCGGAIQHHCSAQSGANPGAIGGANQAQISRQAQIAHGSEVQDLDPSPKRARAYNQGYNQEFLRFWEVYPLKRDKRKAHRAWTGAIRRASAGAIRDGAIRYRDDPNRLDQFTKYAEGWLNGDGWEDDPLPPRLPRGVDPTPRVTTTQADLDAMAAEIRRRNRGDVPREA